jgi:hypothetical protein
MLANVELGLLLHSVSDQMVPHIKCLGMFCFNRIVRKNYCAFIIFVLVKKIEDN